MVERSLGTRQDERATTLGGRGAVEEVKGLGDEGGGQHVVRRERAPAVVHRFRVVVAVGADHGGGGRELALRGAVGEHVAAGHEGELRRGEQAEPGHQLVGRRRPGGRHGVGQHPRAAGQGHDDAALPRGDQHGGIGDRRYAETTGPARAGSQAELQHGIGGRRTDHAVDVGHGDTGVVEGTQGRLERDRRRIVAGQPTCLDGVVDADDGDVAERMAHRRQDVMPRRWGGAGSAAPCRSR